MANTTVRIKSSGAAGNVPGSLEFGELAINYADGKLFYKASNGSIVQFFSSTGGGGGGSSDSFATINANSSLILASSPTDTLNIVPGNNITISACTVSKSIIINSTAGGNKSTSSNSAPTSPAIGDFWYDTLTDVLYRYTTDSVSDFWFDLSGSSVSGGVIRANDYKPRVYTANGTGNTFTVSLGQTQNTVFVFANGLCKIPGTDYTVSNTILTFVVTPALNTVIQIREMPVQG